MDNMAFNNVSPVSPIKEQPFIWMAEYNNNSCLTEFDLSTKQENNFNDIDKDKLTKFGLIGAGNKLFFDCFGGAFYIRGEKYSVKLKYDNNIYDLTHPNNIVKDIITYKRAEANLVRRQNETEHKAKATITGYFFGYKIKLESKGINFNFKPIISIVANKPLYMDLSIMADRNMEAEIIFTKNNKEQFIYSISLKANVTNRSNWNIR